MTIALTDMGKTYAAEKPDDEHPWAIVFTLTAGTPLHELLEERSLAHEPIAAAVLLHEVSQLSAEYDVARELKYELEAHTADNALGIRTNRSIRRATDTMTGSPAAAVTEEEDVGVAVAGSGARVYHGAGPTRSRLGTENGGSTASSAAEREGHESPGPYVERTTILLDQQIEALIAKAKAEHVIMRQAKAAMESIADKIEELKIRKQQRLQDATERGHPESDPADMCGPSTLPALGEAICAQLNSLVKFNVPRHVPIPPSVTSLSASYVVYATDALTNIMSFRLDRALRAYLGVLKITEPVDALMGEHIAKWVPSDRSATHLPIDVQPSKATAFLSTLEDLVGKGEELTIMAAFGAVGRC
jgi:hypothetical protein